MRLDHLDRVRTPGLRLPQPCDQVHRAPFPVLPGERGPEEATDAEGDRRRRNPEEHLPQAGPQRAATGDNRDRRADDEQPITLSTMLMMSAVVPATKK